MVLLVGECKGNCRDAVRLYAERYPERTTPVYSTLKRIIATLRLDGAFVRKQRAPREDRIVGNDERGQEVLQLVALNPNTSSRSIGQEVGLGHSTVLRILHHYTFHPYKIHLHQALTEEDGHRRIEYCVYVQELLREQPHFISRVLWSDESTFHRNGTVNRHNMHYWAVENPHWLGQRYHQARWKINVWAGILGDSIIGPYFFEQNITADLYLAFLMDDVTPALNQLPGDVTANMWFQQDGAPPHYGHNVREWLDARYPNHWIGRGAPLPWPPRSPDLTPMDFFLWGYIKSLVYETEPLNVEDLKGRIRVAMGTITPAMLRSVRRSLTTRLEECLANDGQHFEHLQ